MEIRTLRYFLAVAREENMTRAAEQLHVTQPTLAGHSTIGMTMNRYVHAQPEKIIDAGKKMHSLLAG